MPRLVGDETVAAALHVDTQHPECAGSLLPHGIEGGGLEPQIALIGCCSKGITQCGAKLRDSRPVSEPPKQTCGGHSHRWRSGLR